MQGDPKSSLHTGLHAHAMRAAAAAAVLGWPTTLQTPALSVSDQAAPGETGWDAAVHAACAGPPTSAHIHRPAAWAAAAPGRALRCIGQQRPGSGRNGMRQTSRHLSSFLSYASRSDRSPLPQLTPLGHEPGGRGGWHCKTHSTLGQARPYAIHMGPAACRSTKHRAAPPPLQLLPTHAHLSNTCHGH